MQKLKNEQEYPLIYDSAQVKSEAIEELREVFRFRDLIFQLARRDILTRYKRSFLGVAWTMLNPLGMMIVLTIAFSQILGNTPGYSAYILSGFVAWNFFSQTTTAAMVNLVWGGSLLNRVYIPRSSFALAAIITGFVNATLTMVPLFIVMLVTQVPIRISVITYPLPMLALASFALGVGLLISTFAVYFPDVSEMYQIVLSAWMYLTPIIYPENILPQQTQYLITHFNPMYYLVRLFRVPVFEGRFPIWGEVWPALLIGFGTLIIGWLFYTKKSSEFAYRI